MAGANFQPRMSDLLVKLGERMLQVPECRVHFLTSDLSSTSRVNGQHYFIIAESTVIAERTVALSNHNIAHCTAAYKHSAKKRENITDPASHPTYRIGDASQQHDRAGLHRPTPSRSV